MWVYKEEPYGTMERITELMEQHIPPLTQKDLSQEVGISENTLSAWFKGASKPRKSNLKLVADFLDCDVEFLTCEQPQKRKKSTVFKFPEKSLVDKFLPALQVLMKPTAQKFQYTVDCDTEVGETVYGTYVEGETKYYYEDVVWEYGEPYYKISVNGGEPRKKTETEMEDFIKRIMKYLSYEISQL